MTQIHLKTLKNDRNTPPPNKFTKIPRKLKNEQNIGGFHYLLLQSVDKHAAYANFGRFY